MFGKRYSRRLEAFRTALSVVDLAAEVQPLVFVNDMFTQLTGYTKEDCLGKNCRFLQGEKTNRRAVQKISTSVSNRKRIEICLVNYKKDGTPFHNLLIMSPVQSDEFEDYFHGAQFPLAPSVFGIEKHLEEVDGAIDLLDPKSGKAW